MVFVVRCFAYLLPLTHLLKVQSAMLVGPAGSAHAWDSIVTLLFMGLFWQLLATRLLYVRWSASMRKELNWVRQHGSAKDKIKAALGVVADDLNPANYGIGNRRRARNTERLHLNLMNPQMNRGEENRPPEVSDD